MPKIGLRENFIAETLTNKVVQGMAVTSHRREGPIIWVGLADPNPEGPAMSIEKFDLGDGAAHADLLAKLNELGAMETLCEVIELGFNAEAVLIKVRLGMPNTKEPQPSDVMNSLHVMEPDDTFRALSAEEVADVNADLIKGALGQRSWFEISADDC